MMIRMMIGMRMSQRTVPTNLQVTGRKEKLLYFFAMAKTDLVSVTKIYLDSEIENLEKERLNPVFEYKITF